MGGKSTGRPTTGIFKNFTPLFCRKNIFFLNKNNLKIEIAIHSCR